jgi:hypothetical protein
MEREVSMEEKRGEASEERAAKKDLLAQMVSISFIPYHH